MPAVVRNLSRCVLGLGGALLAASVSASPFLNGDVIVAVSNGSYFHYSANGVYLETLSQGLSGSTTGAAFDSSGRLFTTNFAARKVVAFAGPLDPHDVVQTIDPSSHGSPGGTESLVFAANGDLFVAHATGDGNMHRYAPDGTFLTSYDVGHETTFGADWISLSADQRTMFYTSEGTRILRYDVVSKAQLPDFAALPNGKAFALRLLPPYDGTGGLIVATREVIRRLDGSGAVVATYDAPGQDRWFAVNLDPDGTSFWAADFVTSTFWRFDVASGTVLLGPIGTGTAPNTVWGLAVAGERTGCSGTAILKVFPAPGTACAGETISFRVIAETANAEDCGAITVAATGVPGGAFFEPILPRTGTNVTSDFSWQTSAASIGTRTIRFTAAHATGGTPTERLVTLVVEGPPTATAPSPVSVCAGQTAIFSITGNGTSYQWQSSPDGLAFADVAGATTTSWTTSPQWADSYWRCVVTTACGSVTTPIARLDVVPVPGSPGSSLRAARSGGAVSLSWSAPPEATGYDLRRCVATTAPCTPASFTAVTTTSATDPAPPSGTVWYAVVATNGCGATP